jgi:hypothetical protein
MASKQEQATTTPTMTTQIAASTKDNSFSKVNTLWIYVRIRIIL